MPKDLDLALLARVHELYRAALAEAPREAREWLALRGIGDARLLERFALGFAPGTLKEILSANSRPQRALRDLGLLAGGGRGYECLAGCVVLPLTDTTGRIAALVGYPLDGSAPRHVGMPGAVFNWAAMKSHPRVRLFSDPLTALSELATGDEAAIALAQDRWTALTEATFRDLAPHAVDVENLGRRQEIARRLVKLGIGKKALPASPAAAEQAVENGFSVVFGKRRYLVQAVSQDNPRHLRALVRAIGSTPGRFHLDALDLYSARDRQAFVREGALLFGEDPSLVEADLGRIIPQAEDHLARRPGSATVEVGEAARIEALDVLRDPKLLDRILEDFEKLGLVGEEQNKLTGYLVATSRKMDEPLSMLILSRSAAGKSTLAEAIAAFIPPEDAIRLTRLTGQALFYQKNQSLRQKLLVVEEESGVSEAEYPLRILQSAKRLAVATSRGSHEVEGPVAVIVTSTSSELTDETKSRFLVTSVDESRKQSRAILEAQRRRETGEAVPRDGIIRRHHAIQRCLRPLKVVNPYAPYLSFPDHRLSMRREQPKYLALIRAVTFLRQYQRKETDGALRVELEDIETAHGLADAILGQSLEDLSPPAKRLLEAIYTWKLKGSFTRSQARAQMGWGTTQLWTYLKELSDQEWIIDRGGRPKSYELAWDGREGKIMLGLISIDEIRARFGSHSG